MTEIRIFIKKIVHLWILRQETHISFYFQVEIVCYYYAENLYVDHAITFNCCFVEIADNKMIMQQAFP